MGGATTQVLTVTNTAASGAFTEGLNASFSSATGQANTNGGAVSLLAGGASNNTAMRVGVDTTTAGAKSGSVTLGYQSDGAGTSGLAAISAGNQLINVSGNVYNAAAGSTTPSPVTIANQRIGGNISQALTVANTAAAGVFSEALNASFSGTTGNALNNAGNVTNLVAGGSNNAAMTVRVNTTTAGAKTGTVTLAYQTDGTGPNGNSGLAAIGAGNQIVTVSGNVYQVAQGQIQTAALNFGTVQVGQNVQQVLAIRNIASGAANFVEDLHASFGATTGTGAGLISGTGSITGLAAGATSSAMTVSVNTAAAGTVNGAIAVNYQTAGAVNGTSNGLGVAGAGAEQYGVQGLIQASVINQASPLVNTPTLNLGNVRVGAISPTANVSVTNVATVAPQAALNASISGNAPITASGSFNLLNPGATNNSSLSVGMNTAAAGAINGTATIAFVSDASNVGGCAPNCQLNLASQNVTVTGAVYRTANAQNVTPSVTLASRVGGAASGNVSITNQSPDVFTEALKVQADAAPGGFNVGPNPANIAAQGTGALQVNLNTGTAGTFSGNLTLNHISTGAGTTNAADIGVGSSNVALTGKVYTAATATVQPSVNFGIVHVGDVVTAQGVAVQNNAPVTALNDTLRAQIGGAAGPFTSNNGAVAGLAAGAAANTTALTVGLNTATAGVYNGTATVALRSQNGDMADLVLTPQNVALNGQVNKYANADFHKLSGAGAITRSGNIFTLDFGTVFQNSGALSTHIDVQNLVGGGPADLLSGSLNVTDGNDFTSLLLGAFGGVGADAFSADLLSLTLNSNALTLGLHSDDIELIWNGSNASGYNGPNSTYTLHVIGNIIARGNNVPEPGTILLMTIALAGFGAIRRRKSA